MQMLPLAKIGGMLSSNQWTEELPHNADEGGKAPVIPFNHPFLPPPDYITVTSATSDNKALAYLHFSEQIPSNHSTEVVTPPPDTFI